MTDTIEKTINNCIEDIQTAIAIGAVCQLRVLLDEVALLVTSKDTWNTEIEDARFWLMAAERHEREHGQGSLLVREQFQEDAARMAAIQREMGHVVNPRILAARAAGTEI